MKPRRQTKFYIYKSVAGGMWKRVGFEIAPDPATACEFRLGSQFAKRYKRNRARSRKLTFVGVTTEKLGKVGESLKDSVIRPHLMYLYYGW